MNDRIAKALSKRFERHRIVFWYDEERTLRKDFEALSLPGVEKVEIANNEYGLKHRLLREEPGQKFLLYREGPQPPDLENWLLDVQLAQGEFSTNQVALWLSELELGPEFAEVVKRHMEFFRAGQRIEALKQSLKEDDTASGIRLKMLAVCASSEPRLDSIMEHLLQELAEGGEEKSKSIARCKLSDFLYNQMAHRYGYQSSEPGVRDFAIELFKSCYAMGTGGEAKLNDDALVLLKRWKDSRPFQDSFEALSERYADVLSIEQDLAGRDFREVIELDYFRLIDQKIISDLVREIVARTVSSRDVSAWVRNRRQGYWYDTYRDLYEAIDYAARFIHALGEARLEMSSLAEGVDLYRRTWHQLDFLYRKFTYHGQKSGQTSLLGSLGEQIENLYSNKYLLKLNDRFQAFVDSVSGWDALLLPKQRKFFERWVQPFREKGNKVCVIVSDALRYEIGHELMGLVRREDRYDADLDAALAMLPSYTQLGMAALLPNKESAIADNETASVLVDGQSAQGTANRAKILRAALDGRGEAIRAQDLMQYTRDESRALLKAHDVVYVYHNRIDLAGDKMQSEGRAFEAVEEALEDLVKLVKKLTAANANNILVTADHGFVYQHKELDESDFLGAEPTGDAILHKDRRFVLGKGLAASKGLRKFTARQLGLGGDVEAQIPKSINRLRLRGSGSRFVHGGASLQEVVIPVLRINKKRQSDVTLVDVNIGLSPGASSMITSGQLAVILHQAEPVTDKVQPRTLRAGIYTEAGDPISDQHELTFDSASENPRERESRIRFVLTRKADEANQQDVFLRLEEKLAGTSHYTEYKSRKYLMRRSFTSDFDFQ